MRLNGLIAAPYTPMHADGSLNLAAVAPYARLLARSGVAGVFIGGTTGEGLSLTVAERTALTEAWMASPAGLQIIVHVGSTCVADSCAIAAHAQAAGAVATGYLAPCFFKPTTVANLVDICAAVAAAAPKLPFYYYHIPSMTGVTIPVVGFLKAAASRIPNLAGAKFTYEDFMDFQECTHLDNGRFDILFGRDEALICGLALGARGAIGSTYNFAAPLYNRLIAAFQAGDLAAAQRLQLQSVQLIRGIGAIGPFLAVSKAIMARCGVDCGPTRLPLPAITPAQQQVLDTLLTSLDFSTYACS